MSEETEKPEEMKVELPLTDEEFHDLAARTGATPEAIEIVNVVRHSPASRRTNSTAKSVAGRFASRKMHRSIFSESHRAEFPWLWLAEHDPDVLEIHDQPDLGVPMRWTDPETGKARTSRSTPDFLTIEPPGIVVNEIKAESRLERHAKERPGLYVRRAEETR